jgi:hypothetical protein
MPGHGRSAEHAKVLNHDKKTGPQAPALLDDWGRSLIALLAHAISAPFKTCLSGALVFVTLLRHVRLRRIVIMRTLAHYTTP